MAIPILMYHNVALVPPALYPEGRCLYVTPGAFAAQMALLRRMGYKGLSMSAAMAWLQGDRRGRVAVITFDDGYLDNLEHAMPVLQRHGFSATCYVVNECIGKYNLWDAERLGLRKPMMTTEQLRAWRAGGMEIGAHTRSHPHLTACSDAQLRAEIVDGRAELEGLVGAAVTQFCYPFGDADARVAAVVRGAGFVASPTVRRGRARRGMDPFMLPRIAIDGSDSIAHFAVRTFTPFEDWRGRKAA
jgi:peptidoglycan/xylan/chitin deacetylase (PgdA/CDA1 family)